MDILKNILSQEIIQRLGWTLVHFVWQAAAIGLLLAIVLRLLRKSSANLRYIIACMALALIVLMPAVTIRMIGVSVETIEPVKHLSVDLPKAGVETQAVVEMPRLQSPPEQAAVTPPVSLKDRFVEAVEPSLPFIVVGWLVGVFGLSIWHLGGWAQLQRLRRKRVKQVSERVNLRLRHLAEQLGIKRAVEIAESALVQVPAVVGWLRPVILLPASALTGLSGEQLEAILAHELAHIKRCDYLVNMLQTAVEILGFYHPAVWWVSHKIRAERENCCDDLAVSVSGDRVRYARALTSLEEVRAGYTLAVAASGGSLFQRIRRLLSKDSANEAKPSWLPSAIAIMLIVALLIPTALALSARAVEKQGLKAEGGDRCYFTGRFELEKDIPIRLELKPQGKRVLVSADSIRFDRDGSDIKVFFKTNVRSGLVFDWRTRLKLLDDKGQATNTREKEIVKKSSALVSGNPIYMEKNIEFPSLSVSDIEDSRRFEISLGLIGPVRDSLRREIDKMVEMELIEGRVTDWQGKPIVDAIVTVVEHKPNASGFRIPGTTTDEQGYYRFGAVNWLYRLRVEYMQELPSGTEYYEVLNLKQILQGSTKVDFEFNKPEKGDSSIECRVINSFGNPLTKYKVNVSLDVDWKEVDFEDSVGGYLKYFWYTKRIEDDEGRFKLDEIPAGNYKIWVISEEKEYEWPRKKVTIAQGEAKEEIIQVTSKFVLYGCVLFDDGMPAVIKPSPWPGAKSSILLPMGSRARGIADLDANGYFQVHLNASEYENLKIGKRQLVINIPTLQEGRRKTAGNFPFELLSEERDKAGVVRVKRPENKKPASPAVEVRPGESAAPLRDEELRQRMEAAKKLSDMGKAMLIFANDHDERYPDKLEDLTKVDLTKEEIDWLKKNIEYLGKGKTVTISPQAVIAYDKTLLEQENSQGTNVLYNSLRVKFEKPETLKKLGIVTKEKPATQILTSARILLVPADLPQLKEIISDDKSKTRIITPEKLEEFLNAVRNTPQAKIISAPKLLTNDGEVGEIRTENAKDFESIKLNIKNTVAADRKTITLDLVFECTRDEAEEQTITRVSAKATLLSEHAIAVAVNIAEKDQILILIVKPQIQENQLPKTGVVAPDEAKATDNEVSDGFGRVEGRCFIGSSPAANKTLCLYPFTFNDSVETQKEFKATTDSDGYFAFENIPAGWAKIGRQAKMGKSSWSITSRIATEIKPGETSNVTIGGVGRPVVGRCVTPESYDKRIDYGFGTRLLTSHRDEPPYPANFDQMTKRQQTKWKNEWGQTKEGRASFRNYQLKEKTFAFKLNDDGSFRIDDVPAGKYDILIWIEESRFRKVGLPEEIASYHSVIDVPQFPGLQSDEPFNLGDLELRMEERLNIGDSVPQLELETLAGRKIKVSDFRGKHILLSFYSTYFYPVRSKLLDEIYQGYGRDGRLVMIDFIGDDTLEQVKQYVKEQNFKWPQVYLEDYYNNPVVKAYGAWEISFMFFIGPDGKLISKHLVGQNLKETITQHLGQPLEFKPPVDLKSEKEVSKKDEIEITARLLLLPVDANEITSFFEDKSLEDALVKTYRHPDLKCYSLNDKQVDQLLMLSNTNPGSKLLTSPEVVVNDWEDATMRLQKAIRYSVNSANSDESEVKELNVGTIFQVTPGLEEGGRIISLDFKLEHTNLIEFDENNLPRIEMHEIASRISVPDGGTLLLGGQKITDNQDGQKVQKVLWCSIKAVKLEPDKSPLNN